MSSATGNSLTSGDVLASGSQAASKLSWSAPAAARGVPAPSACGAVMESVAEGTEPDGSEATASPPPQLDSAQEQWLDMLHQGTRTVHMCCSASAFRLVIATLALSPNILVMIALRVRAPVASH